MPLAYLYKDFFLPRQALVKPSFTCFIRFFDFSFLIGSDRSQRLGMGTSQGFEEDKAGPPRPKVISCGLVAQRAKLFEQKIERNRILKEEIKSGTSR